MGVSEHAVTAAAEALVTTPADGLRLDAAATKERVPLTPLPLAAVRLTPGSPHFEVRAAYLQRGFLYALWD